MSIDSMAGGRVRATEPRTSEQHRDVWRLIPWVINGTASADDVRRVEDHIASCPACRAEHRFQKALSEAIAVETVEPHNPEAGLRKLNETLDRRALLDVPLPTHGGGAPRRPQSLWQRASVPLAVLQTLVIAGLAVHALTTDEQRHAANGAAAAQYETLSSPTPTSDARRSPQIRLAASAGTRFGDLLTVLQRERLEVVESDATNGTFGLAWSTPSASPDAARMTSTLAALRNVPGVVLAELVPSFSTPSGAASRGRTP